MDLFIDTNIFVRFFDTTGESLDELQQLVAAIESSGWTLWLPDQVKREYWKNRTSTINGLMKSFEKSKPLNDVPLLVREDEMFGELRSLSNELEHKKAELTARIKTLIEDENSKADLLIKELFSKANELDTTDFFQEAFERAQRHAPPGKKDDLGDRINWISLIKDIPENTGLHIISDDGDFEQGGSLMPYLKHEWKQKNGGELFLSKRLSQFMADNFSDAKHAINEEQSIYIQRLSDSSNFAETHEVVSKFPKLKYMTEELTENLFQAIRLNSQVCWIASDPDVRNLIESFIAESDHLGENQKALLQAEIDEN